MNVNTGQREGHGAAQLHEENGRYCKDSAEVQG